MAITAVPLHKNMKTYTMKQACKLTGMNYEALKFYCNSGLVPGLKRDQNNRRVFDERCIAWINDLTCLKRCGLGIKEMRHYTRLCLEGESSIPERQEILAEKREHLETQLEELRKAIAYIDEKTALLRRRDCRQDGILQQRHRHDAKRLTAFRR